MSGYIINRENQEIVVNIPNVEQLSTTSVIFAGGLSLSDLENEEVNDILELVKAYSPGGEGYEEGYIDGSNDAKTMIAADHRPIAEEYKTILIDVPEIQEQDPTNLIGQRNIFSLSADYLGGGSPGTPFSYDDIVQVFQMTSKAIWTDGENIYYSTGSTQRVLEKETSTWLTKTWTGLTSFEGSGVWTDGDKIYYSSASNQYVLNKETSTWSKKTWKGLTNFSGSNVWTDGENIYSSSASNQYVLNKETSTWDVKTWTGLTSFTGQYVWTDGDNIYYSSSSNQYVLDKETSTWNVKTWTGYTPSTGTNVWIDGDNIYYSGSSNQYVLDKATSTWTKKTWAGLTSFDGNGVWFDDDNIYYSSSTSSTVTQYILNKETSNWTTKTFYNKFTSTIYIMKNNIVYNIRTDVNMSFVPK